MSDSPHMLSQALLYAGAGINVFPVNGEKIPLTGTGGFHHATTDRGQIEAWWQQWPDAGIATPDYDVVDVDLYKPGVAEHWKAIQSLVPDGTPQTKTPRGGLQFFFEAGSLNGCKFANGIDPRYAGKNYVLLPPSQFADHGRYQFAVSLLTGKLRPAPVFPGRKHNGPAPPIGDKIPYGSQHRELVSLAGSMRRRGMNADEIFAALWQVNVGRCEQPGPEKNIRQIADSVSSYEPGPKPRSEPAEQQAELVGFLFTDLGNAHRFVATHAGRFLYCREERNWLEWHDGRWRRDVTGAAERATVEVVEALWAQVMELPFEERKEPAKWALHSQSAAAIRNTLTIAATDAKMVVTIGHLDTNPFLLSCGNGTLDLRTGELREPDPADLITLGTDIKYVPGAPRGRWESFLREIFDDDLDLVAFSKRFYGSCLTGDTRDRALAIEQGKGFNGKTVVNRIIQFVMGDFAHTAPIRVVMRTRQAEIPNEVAALHRKRLVVIAETADGHRLDENRVKMLTGQDKVPARFLHREWFTFEPEYKLVLYTNFRPKVDGSDSAIWDRIKLIPFRVSFAGREDTELSAKLKAEAEGILAWLVEGCLEWQENGLGTCDAVEQATAAYRGENDVIGRFVNECCEFGDDFRVLRKTLRAALSRYCEDTGDDMPAATTLGRWLTERSVRESRKDNKRAYRGIRLTEESE